MVNDTQVPFHSPPAVKVASDLIAAIDPDYLIYNGDIADMDAVSSHKKSRHETLRTFTIQDEIDMTIAIADQLSAGTKAKRIQIDGNHEDRLERYLGSMAPEIGSLRGLQMPAVFEYEKRGFLSYHPYKTGVWITPHLYVYHGATARKMPGASVQAEISKIGSSMIIGHTHKRAHVRFKLGDKDVIGIEGACLCQMDPGYATHTNWAWGITVVTVHKDGRFTPEVIDIVNDRHTGKVFAFYQGTMFTAKADLDDKMAVPWQPTSPVVFK